ncbi:MAG: hypothetical protein ACO1SX_17320 [Actinomycetota bacterium]
MNSLVQNFPSRERSICCYLEPYDFEYVPFSEKGGLGKAYALFGERR